MGHLSEYPSLVFFMDLKIAAASKLRPAGKVAFVASLPAKASLFDIGCGNRSAERMKRIQPGIRYVGLDVADYHQSVESLDAMDRYVLSTSPDFAATIGNVGEQFDAVVSAHNIEHCEDPDAVIDAMCKVIKPGGMLFLAFPSEASVNFPRRDGTLNFFDDPTHKAVPSFSKLHNRLKGNEMVIEKSIPRSRPAAYAAVGLMIEPWSALTRRVDRHGASWALWGFESIIWARKAVA